MTATGIPRDFWSRRLFQMRAPFYQAAFLDSGRHSAVTMEYLAGFSSGARRHHPPVNTHNRGDFTIDAILGNAEKAESFKRNAHEPVSYSYSDIVHDVNHARLFGSKRTTKAKRLKREHHQQQEANRRDAIDDGAFISPLNYIV